MPSETKTYTDNVPHTQVRSVADVSWSPIPDAPRPTVLRLEFVVKPVDLDIALAHLEMTAPEGLIVYARGRGPRGGWRGLRYTREPGIVVRLARVRNITFHLVVGGGEGLFYD